jgi:hypothetical protein
VVEYIYPHIQAASCWAISLEFAMLVDPNRSARIAEEIFHSSLSSWQRLLLAAAADIKEGGWCRDGKKCIMGALWDASFRSARSVPKGAFEAAQYALVAFSNIPSRIGMIKLPATRMRSSTRCNWLHWVATLLTTMSRKFAAPPDRVA